MSFVYGNSLKNNVVAIIVPDKENARLWAERNGNLGAGKGETPTFDAICQNADYKKALIADIMELAT